MTHDTPSPSHSGGPQRSWRVPVLAGALVLAVVVGLAVLLGGEDDEPSAASPAGSTTSADQTSSPSGSPGAEDPAAEESGSSESGEGSAEPIEEPALSPVVLKAARAAMRAGFPALVPAATPAGWTVTAASYSDKGGGAWRVDLTDASGAPVVLVQSPGRVADLVAAQLGAKAAQAGTVDLGDFGIGVWDVYEGGQGTGIATSLPSTSALVVASGPDVAAELAQTLLTAEDADLPEAG